MLLQIRQHLHDRFGATGPVWIAATRTDDGSTDGNLTFQIKFMIRGRDLTLNVSANDMEKNGTSSLDGAYTRLMGR